LNSFQARRIADTYVTMLVQQRDEEGYELSLVISPRIDATNFSTNVTYDYDNLVDLVSDLHELEDLIRETHRSLTPKF